MNEQPRLECKRLILRAVSLEDAAEVTALVGAREIASMTVAIPHPYEEGMARDWIGQHRSGLEAGEGVSYALIERDSNRLVGAIGLRIDKDHRKAELGYWIGVQFWGNGYATEAAKRLIEYGFRDLKLNRIYARHFVRNPASGKVLRKAGMYFEGRLREDILKWGQFEDLDAYAILNKEFEGHRK